MDYKKKYLKYKLQYLNLKKQVGLGRTSYQYTTTVPEFKDNTRDQYISDKERALNTITIVDNIDVKEFNDVANIILKNIDKINITAITKEKLLEYIRKKNPNIVEIEGFFNIKKDYKEEQNDGTFVKKTDFDEIFQPDKIPKNITSEGFEPYKGSGKKNLNTTMKTLKTQGVKYVILEAAGETGLIELYTKYGFESIIKGYDYYLGEEKLDVSTNHIMFGLIDNIIKHSSTT